MRITHLALLAALASTQAAFAADAAPATPPAGDVRRLALGGAGGWDDLSVDAVAHRLYLSRSDRVMVVDTNTGQLVGEVPGTSGVHGIALVPSLHEGFASDGKADAVTAFDTNTLKPLGDIKVTGSNPDAILYDAASQRVFAFNGHSANATVIDPAKRTVVGTIALDGKPEFARADGHGQIYANIEDKAELVRIDAATMKVMATWPMPGCEEPSGLAIDDVHRRVFSACDNHKLVVTDADNGKHVADVAIGDGPDGAVFDAASSLVFVPNGHDGTLTVAHQDDADHYRVVATIPTQKSARTIVLDETAHRLYLPAADFDPLPSGSPPHARPPMKAGSFVVLEVGEPHT
ncbi:MAG TPA: YncE family protein [Xanthomonadaceae bacterium]